MTQRFFWIAFATGLAAVAWVGVGFVGTHALARACIDDWLRARSA